MTNTGIIDLFSNGIDIEIQGRRMGQVKIPSDFVPHTFAPLLGEHLFIAGDMLENGMIVVLGDNSVRGNPNQLSPEYPDRKHGFVPSEYDRARIEETARWALVTDLKITKNGPDSQLVTFTAIYSDGTMRDRKYNTRYKWAVLSKFEVLPVCPVCNVVHVPGEENDVDIDQMTRNVTSQIFDEEMTFDEFVNRVKDEPDFVDQLFTRTINKLTGGLLRELEAGEDTSDEEVDDDAPRDDETPLEFLERMRDKAEERGEYSQDERPKLAPIEDPAITALRAKLMGTPAQTEIGLNGYPVDENLSIQRNQ